MTRIRPRTLASAGLYAIGPIVCAVVYLREGAAPFLRDDHAVQAFTGLCFLAMGVPLLLLEGVPAAARYLLSLAAAWLATDEWLTVHECIKHGPLTRGKLPGETLVVLYGVGGVAVLAWMAWRAPAGGRRHALAAVAALAVVAASDLAGAPRFPWREAMEEAAEMSAAIAVLLLAATRSSRTGVRTWLLAAGVTAWNGWWLTTAIGWLRPLFCPARFL